MIVLALAELAELIWIAPLAAVAVCITFAGCILGATRSTDCRRVGNTRKGAAWFSLAVVSGVLTLGEVAAGISVIVAG